MAFPSPYPVPLTQTQTNGLDELCWDALAGLRGFLGGLLYVYFNYNKQRRLYSLLLCIHVGHLFRWAPGTRSALTVQGLTRPVRERRSQGEGRTPRTVSTRPTPRSAAPGLLTRTPPGLVTVKYLGTEENTADLFTKILDRQPFEKHRKTVLNTAANDGVPSARDKKAMGAWPRRF